jgi:prephenate dehydrogenase
VSGAVPEPVALVGLGVLGGSLSRALRGLESPPTVSAYARSGRDVSAALEAGVIDRAATGVADAVRGAALVIVATPLGAEEAVLRAAAPELVPEALVLDVGSLQVPALAAATASGLSARFVACHPMAGSEASGFEAGDATLFRDRPVWLSGPGGEDEALLGEARTFWSALGARPAVIDADLHDTRMAVVSHLPQVLANGLARVLEEGGFTVDDLGPAGRDMTRLAASSPELWRDVFSHSGPQVAALLRLLGRELDGWARILDGQDLDEVGRRMARTRRWRNP